MSQIEILDPVELVELVESQNLIIQDQQQQLMSVFNALRRLNKRLNSLEKTVSDERSKLNGYINPPLPRA